MDIGEPHPARLGQALATVGDELLLNGGYKFKSIGTAGAHKVCVSQTSLFNPATQAWREGPAAPEERAGHTLISLGKEVVLYGGVNPLLKARRGNVVVLDTDTMEWREVSIRGELDCNCPIFRGEKAKKSGDLTDVNDNGRERSSS